VVFFACFFLLQKKSRWGVRGNTPLYEKFKCFNQIIFR
jgi:hypothetical protein